MASKKKAVAKKQNTEMQTYEGMDASDGGGFENADSDSFSVPFIKVLQKLSPVVDEDHEDHIDGAKAGMFYNTVTNELFPDGLTVIPCHYARVFIEWVPRESGGGIVNVFEPDAGVNLLESCTRDGPEFGGFVMSRSWSQNIRMSHSGMKYSGWQKKAEASACCILVFDWLVNCSTPRCPKKCSVLSIQISKQPSSLLM